MEKDSLRELKSALYEKDAQPLVSVVMIAYNIEKYLPDAIESVLNQQTNFKVELVIGEDCSKDGTRTIALEYQRKYPSLIRVLLPEKNQGLTPNCVATHNACRGKYIALLDGDDYWTHPLKLQRQVEFLESHPEYSGCAHQSEKFYEDNSSPRTLFGEEVDKIYELKDTLTHRKFHTSALTYRKEIWDRVGGIPQGISSNERAIYPMIALFGKIHYFKESMCVYRITTSGLSSRISYKELETDLIMIPWLKNIDPDFPSRRFASFLHLCIFTYGTNKMTFLPLLKHYFLFNINSFSTFPRNLGDLKWGTIFFLKKIFK
jgi:glycosyltransferase involved in cell wall biosynthesis